MKREEVVALLVSHEQLSALCSTLASHNQDLTRQLDWFKQQIFGQKSERRAPELDARQLTLGEQPAFGEELESTTTIAEHSRRKRSERETEQPETDPLRFDESVPVEEIRLSPPRIDEEHELVSEKVTYRLAQRPGSYVVLKYIRPVIKLKSDGALVCAPAPASVLGKSLADVSLLALMAIDKFAYHLPLYRQHQRMEAAGVHLARSTLTGLLQRAAELLVPIYEAQFLSVLQSPVIAMDETPIRAGVEGSGKMKKGYFWPIYGDRGEVVFPFAESRSERVIREFLGGFGGVLLTDGYVAYERYVGQVNGIVHALCWSHARRKFLKAEEIEPELTKSALEQIRTLYAEEARIGSKLIEASKRLELRALHSKPIVDRFFEWLKGTIEERVLLPKNPFTEAAHYALSREKGLRVFLEYPDVPIDTNHLEREIRPLALGRKNWLFCWTELGAHHVGVFNSLLATCRMQGLDPYGYLVDVLQRVEDHSMRDVALLTPRLWKETFAAAPRRAALDRVVKNASA